ncbi:MAG: helix-turn-helix transcriptional regulator [Oscillospiraceae bacterium]|jgi:transcriptional regulator with XRE-family HTH domain
MITGKEGEVMVSAALVGQVIQSYRLRKGMSQEVLSGLAGLDRTHYSKIERGLRSPTLDTLFKIAQALDIPPSDIVRQIEQQIAEHPEP